MFKDSLDIEKYKSCLNMNYEEKAWLDRINDNKTNITKLVLHPMSNHDPICRSDCPFSRRCQEIWNRK